MGGGQACRIRVLEWTNSIPYTGPDKRCTGVVFTPGPREAGRRKVSYEGHVQGVGFRYSKHRQAHVCKGFQRKGLCANPVNICRRCGASGCHRHCCRRCGEWLELLIYGFGKYLQNLSNAGVKLVVEGRVEEIDVFLRRIDGELGHHINDCKRTQVTPAK